MLNWQQLRLMSCMLIIIMTTTYSPTHSPNRVAFWQLVLLWLLVPILAVLLLIARFEWQYRDRIYPGIQALGLDLSGLTPEKAKAELQVAAAQYDLPPLAIRYGDQVWPLQTAELGVQVDVNEVVAASFARGRNQDPLTNLQVQWQTFWQGVQQTPRLSAKPGAVTAAVAARTVPLNRPATEPRLTLSDLQVVISASRPGQVVDVLATRDQVLQRISAGTGGVVDVVVREVQAAAADVSAGQEAIQQVLDHPIVLADSQGEFQFALDPATMATVLSWKADPDVTGGLRPEIDEEKLRALVEGWAQQVYRPPLNARFDFDTKTGALIELSPSVNGYALDVDATVAAVVDAVQTGKAEAVLPIQMLRPAVASEDAANFGIKELVSEGVTRFAGSSAARIKNIEVAASKFVGVVIPPDGIFSFNKYVGDVTAANGFEDSLIISGDRTAVGVGGGVCQVSTTVFRAAWFGGFPIVERWNHGYVVSWYGEPGLDATIYTPNVDFKFRNTTGNYLLIKPVVDSKKGILKFQFYGTKPDWTVEAPKPKISNRRDPPPPLYIEDPSLPDGKAVQFDWAVRGMDTVATRKVIAADGTVLLENRMESHYQPWQAKYRFGPGFTPPANAEVVYAQESGSS